MELKDIFEFSLYIQDRDTFYKTDDPKEESLKDKIIVKKYGYAYREVSYLAELIRPKNNIPSGRSPTARDTLLRTLFLFVSLEDTRSLIDAERSLDQENWDTVFDYVDKFMIKNEKIDKKTQVIFDAKTEHPALVFMLQILLSFNSLYSYNRGIDHSIVKQSNLIQDCRKILNEKGEKFDYIYQTDDEILSDYVLYRMIKISIEKLKKIHEVNGTFAEFVIFQKKLYKSFFKRYIKYTKPITSFEMRNKLQWLNEKTAESVPLYKIWGQRYDMFQEKLHLLTEDDFEIMLNIWRGLFNFHPSEELVKKITDEVKEAYPNEDEHVIQTLIEKRVKEETEAAYIFDRLMQDAKRKKKREEKIKWLTTEYDKSSV